MTSHSTKMAAHTAVEVPEPPRYIEFPSVEPGTMRNGKPVLNRWSTKITAGHNFPGAKVGAVFSMARS